MQRAEQEKQSAIIRAQGEAESIALVGQVESYFERKMNYSVTFPGSLFEIANSLGSGRKS